MATTMLISSLTLLGGMLGSLGLLARSRTATPIPARDR
jgi:hypothetical protein